MATPPLICNTIEFEGSIFQRCNLQVIKGTTVIREISLCDTNIVVSDYSSFNGCVYPSSSLLLNTENLGGISFIMIKASYPTSLPVSSRFINIIYNNKFLPMANLTILTANPGSSNWAPNRIWDLNPNGSELASPYFSDGGMLLYNPHGVKVNVEILLANKITGTSDDEGLISSSEGDFIIAE
jgi:hypothetical protein